MNINIAAKTARRIKELARDIMKPWLEIHSLILKLDGHHNRLMGKGIKFISQEMHDVILELADEINNELTEQENK